MATKETDVKVRNHGGKRRHSEGDVVPAVSDNSDLPRRSSLAKRPRILMDSHRDARGIPNRLVIQFLPQMTRQFSLPSMSSCMSMAQADFCSLSHATYLCCVLHCSTIVNYIAGTFIHTSLTYDMYFSHWLCTHTNLHRCFFL